MNHRSKYGLLASLPFQLVMIFVGSLLFGDYVPLLIKELLFTTSLVIKSGLIFVLPLIVFACIFSSILEIQMGGAVFITLFTLFAICFSNFVSTLVAFSASHVFLNIFSSNFHLQGNPTQTIAELSPLIPISGMSWVSNEKALFFGLVTAITVKFWSSKLEESRALARLLKSYAHFILNRIFVPVVPLFVLGFSLKLQHDQVLSQIVERYSLVLSFTLAVQIFYLGFLYFLGAGFRLSRFVDSVGAVTPSVLSGFSTMSSMASLPLTLEAAERNTKNPSLARLVVPMSVNNHLVGDSIFIPLIAIMMITGSQGQTVDFFQYLHFVLYFVLAKFAVAAVPGGGIIVMIPILEKYLGLGHEMLSLITAIYILFDPLITATNVAGNGAFAILVARMGSWVGVRASDHR